VKDLFLAGYKVGWAECPTPEKEFGMDFKLRNISDKYFAGRFFFLKPDSNLMT